MTPTSDTAEDRFDADLILERALAADEADLAAHGRPQPTLADLAEAAYRAFEIGVWEMSRDRHAEARTWLSAAVDSGIAEARPLLAICLQVTDPVPERRAAVADEHDQRLAETLLSLGEQPSETAEATPTPIYDEVLAQIAAWVRRRVDAADMPPAEPEDTSGQRANEPLLRGSAAGVWSAAAERYGPGTAGIGAWALLIDNVRSADVSVPACAPDVLPQGASRRAAWALPAAGAAADGTEINQLARDAADGDPAAAAAALELIRPLVVPYCRASFGQRHPLWAAADEIAEDVCLSVLVRLQEHRADSGSFLRLVYAIAAEKVAGAAQEIGRARRTGIVHGPGLRRWDQQETATSALDLGDRLTRLLSALPRAHQEVLILRIVVGLSAADTAEALGISAGNVRVTQSRALTRLRELARNHGW
ncbi:sigma-70 family RNA polymerase sigma factor (plasmid) [Amycolatopsis sp. FU40]|uniref:sigma-70 family RNA polymerase sigma factor n=1 Tax=Amycolatopsis sp. FU40 TaxID=2914159 RepID=UPI001F03110E|nr:sigma-70 family RNA polymerase sigma factor [Amycolatopsis sp. FU40]UKD50833.1 sigma-70 family RNA polymerase sigma factor [Amycolatopsis sp. FU40]